MTLFYCSCGEYEKVQLMKEKELFEMNAKIFKCKSCGEEFTYINKNGSQVTYKISRNKKIK